MPAVKHETYWDKYYQKESNDHTMWHCEDEIPCIAKNHKTSLDIARFLWEKTEHSVDSIKLMPPLPGMKILELGCGKGGFTMAYLKKYPAIDFELFALDFSAVSLDICQKFLRKNDLHKRVTLIQGDILNLPFKDNFFDLIICPSVLEHIPDQKRALKEISRVLKKDGKCLISTDNKKAYISRISLWRLTNGLANILKDLKILRREKGYFIANDPKQFSQILTDVGLCTEHLSHTEFGFPGFRSLIRLMSRSKKIEQFLLPRIQKIEASSCRGNGIFHSVFINISKK